MPSFSCSSSSDIWNRALSVSWCVAPTAQELWANSLTLLPIAGLTSLVKLHCTRDTSQEWVTTGSLTGSHRVNMWAIKWPKRSAVIPSGWNQHFTVVHHIFFSHKDGINSRKWCPYDSLIGICTTCRMIPCLNHHSVRSWYICDWGMLPFSTMVCACCQLHCIPRSCCYLTALNPRAVWHLPEVNSVHYLIAISTGGLQLVFLLANSKQTSPSVQARQITYISFLFNLY